MKELEIKEELYNIELITTQVLEVIVDKLVLNQRQEQEKQKSTSKNINYKNSVKVGHLKKKIKD